MKKFLIGVVTSALLVLSCCTKNPNTLKDITGNDSISVVVDSAKVVDLKNDSIEKAQNEAYELEKFDISKAESLRLKHKADSLATVDAQISHLLVQNTQIIKNAKADLASLNAKKITLAVYKARLTKTLNTPVSKYPGIVEVAYVNLSDSLSTSGKINALNAYNYRLENVEIPGYEKTIKTNSQSLLHKKLIIANTRFYLNITIKNPSQDKFLRGWSNRALAQ